MVAAQRRWDRKGVRLTVIGVLAGAAAVVVFWILTPGIPQTISPNLAALPSNLETAFGGAATYATRNNGSFAGLLTGSDGISPIQVLSAGLAYTTGNSTGPHVISLRVGRGSTSLIMVAFARGTLTCYGILDLLAKQSTEAFGESSKGVYYFLKIGTTTCDASTVMPTAISTRGFPPA